MADQYLTIPVVSTAILWRKPLAWGYTLLATGTILASHANIGALGYGAPWAGWFRAHGFALINAQEGSSLYPQMGALAAWGWQMMPWGRDG